MKKRLMLCLAAAALSPGAASAGFLSPADFDANARVVAYDNLGLPFVNEDPLAISGDTYTTFRDFHILYENDWGQFVFGTSGGALATDIGNETLQIVLGADEPKAGVYIDAGNAWSATVTFFDASNTQLAVGFYSGNALQAQFAGFEPDSGAVHRIDIVDTSSVQQNLFIKDLMTEGASPAAAPEPSALILVCLGGLGLAGYGWLRRRKPSCVA